MGNGATALKTFERTRKRRRRRAAKGNGEPLRTQGPRSVNSKPDGEERLIVERRARPARDGASFHCKRNAISRKRGGEIF